VPRKEVHQLREYQLACVHAPGSTVGDWGVPEADYGEPG
jgi:hypothetical protein